MGRMSRVGRALAIGLFLLLSTTIGAAQTVWFDALAARVDGQPILVSDVSLNERLFGSGKAFFELSPGDRDAAVGSLIEQHLLLVEATRFGVAQPDDQTIRETTAALRPRLGADAERVGDVGLNTRVRDFLWVDAFVDARIRAFVMIRDSRVAERFVAQGAPLTGETGAQARARIREELATEEAATRLARYLERLTGRAEIKRYPLSDPPF